MKASRGKLIKGLILKLKESLLSVLPVAAVVVLLNFTPAVDFSAREILVFIVSAAAMIFGIGLFNIGADLAMSPMGEHIGASLTKTGKFSRVLGVSFLMGLLITVAEPDLSVLASQVSEVMNGTVLILSVGVGVGLFLVVSVLKIIFKKPLSVLLLFFYMVLFALIALVAVNGNSDMVALAYDSGGVTTGPITVPFIMAFGLGIAATFGGSDMGENSFGLIALCSVGPILAVSVLGITASGKISYTVPDYSVGAHLGEAFWPTVMASVKDVGLALGLVVLLFAILQALFLKLPLRRLRGIAVGILYTFVGLVVFLTAVTVGFMPVGYKLGTELASRSPRLLAVFGFIIGMVVVLAEPAVHVLNRQVEDVTDGAVTKTSMMTALSVGVGISIGLSMLRIYFDFSILYYLIPGYLISLGLSIFVPAIYTAIAFDSGGVASGPLTSGFILPLAIGACAVLQGEGKIMSDAFGIVAMVAMTPLITIQILGFRAIVTSKIRKKTAMRRILSSDDEQIINFM